MINELSYPGIPFLSNFISSPNYSGFGTWYDEKFKNDDDTFIPHPFTVVPHPKEQIKVLFTKLIFLCFALNAG